MKDLQINGLRKVIQNRGKDFWLKKMVRDGTIKANQLIKARDFISNPIIGPSTQREINEAVNAGAIIERKEGGESHWFITSEEIIKGGKKIITESKKYREWEAKKRAAQGYDYYNKESMDALIRNEEEDKMTKEVNRLFPGNTTV